MNSTAAEHGEYLKKLLPFLDMLIEVGSAESLSFNLH